MDSIRRSATRWWPVVAVGAALAVAAYGCSEDVDTTPPGGGGSGGTGGAEGGSGGMGGAGESITFIAVSSEFASLDYTPKEGATVAFDLPGGERVELATDADGKVTFDGIHWSQGSASVTAYLQGHNMWSYAGFDEADLAEATLVNDAVPLYLNDSGPAPPDTVTVSGTFTGVDTGHNVNVNVVHTDFGTEWMGGGNGTFSVSVPSGEPFTLQAFELDNPTTSGQGYSMPIYQVMHQEFPATASDMTGVVLDFTANAVTTNTADVTFATPTRAESPVRAGSGVGLVCPLESYFCTGWSTALDISADGNQFEASLLWVEPTWAATPTAFMRVYDGSNLISYRRVLAWPQSGSLGTLPDTPEWATPADPNTPHPLHDAIEWQMFESDVPHISLRLVRGNTFVWGIAAGADATTVTVPQPPSTVDKAAVFGPLLQGFVLTGWWDDTTNTWDAYSVSDNALFTP